ncbi:MAG: MATE family efflux transporter [Planctomycetes bacterium]|nr:MATE family efflux transporter [Planctomycetota bacterium]
MITSTLKNRWRGEGGFAEVLRVAFPLILSSSALTIQMFVDRMFLMWYDQDAMSASMQAGITNFTFVALFMGTASYANTFVAQYYGAGQKDRIGPAVWQAIYFSVVAGMLMWLLVPAAKYIFGWIGHVDQLRQYEITYFKVITFSALPSLIGSSISCFYTGRSKTWTVLWVNLLGNAVNLVLDYCLVFGKFGFPRMGVKGAAVATVIAASVAAVVYVAIFLSSANRRQFNTGAGFKFEPELFGRLLKFGLPNGFHFMLDVSAFTMFMVFVGKIDAVALAATVVVFQLNMLGFVPMSGMGMAVNVLVGQYLGSDRPALAVRSTWSASMMCFGYMVIVSAAFVLVPDVFLAPFAANADPAAFAPCRDIASKLLYFVALYCLFDTGNIIFSATLKGAGDTRFVMYLSLSLSWIVMVLPSYIAMKMGWGIYVIWGFTTSFICSLAVCFFIRFMQGRWKMMRVIEPIPPAPIPPAPQVPTIEVEAP